MLLIGLGIYLGFYDKSSNNANNNKSSNAQEILEPTNPPSNPPSPVPVDQNNNSGHDNTPNIEEPIEFVFAGDVMLDRDIWSRMKKFGLSYPFEKIKNFFDGDINFVNLEGPITSSNRHAVAYGPLLFNFDPKVTGELAKNNINLVSLANNHSLNQGEGGYQQTASNLELADIDYFGHQTKLDETLILKKEIKNRKLVFIGWNQVDDSGKNYQKLLGIIKKLRPSSDWIMVFPHWGQEYARQNKQQVEQAHAILDAGADMIIGAHPHVVQGIELYKNKPIFYSLGNFIFDQYWSQETQRGLALKLKIAGKDLSFDLIPIHLPLGQARIAAKSERDITIDRLLSLSDASLAKAISSGVLTILDR